VVSSHQPSHIETSASGRTSTRPVRSWSRHWHSRSRTVACEHGSTSTPSRGSSRIWTYSASTSNGVCSTRHQIVFAPAWSRSVTYRAATASWRSSTRTRSTNDATFVGDRGAGTDAKTLEESCCAADFGVSVTDICLSQDVLAGSPCTLPGARKTGRRERSRNDILLDLLEPLPGRRNMHIYWLADRRLREPDV